MEGGGVEGWWWMKSWIGVAGVKEGKEELVRWGRRDYSVLLLKCRFNGEPVWPSGKALGW